MPPATGNVEHVARSGRDEHRVSAKSTTPGTGSEHVENTVTDVIRRFDPPFAFALQYDDQAAGEIGMTWRVKRGAMRIRGHLAQRIDTETRAQIGIGAGYGWRECGKILQQIPGARPDRIEQGRTIGERKADRRPGRGRGRGVETRIFEQREESRRYSCRTG